MVPSRYQHPVLAQHRLITLLPPDLVSEVNHAYFLHILATNPKRVIPSGKSLISIVTQEKLGDSWLDDRDQKPKLEHRVAQSMHAAFWDSVSCIAHREIWLLILSPRQWINFPLQYPQSKIYI